jgi:hypothetical protein
MIGHFHGDDVSFRHRITVAAQYIRGFLGIVGDKPDGADI